MDNFTITYILIFALIFSGLLMSMTNGVSDDKTFGTKITKKDYPIFVYIFIMVLIATAIYLLFFFKV